jgi:hypothetical protein
MRQIVVPIVAMLLIASSALAAAARQATPASGPFADLGLPELDITVTATGYEGIPARLTAGR